MYKTLGLLLLLGVVHSETNVSKDLQATFDEVFGKPKSSPGEEDSCVTDKGVAGVCVSFYQCKTDGTLNTGGEGMLDIRLLSVCGGYAKVCCAASDMKDPNLPEPPPQRPGCGWRNSEGAGMRTTGETAGETKFGEFPWMVEIYGVDVSTGEEMKLYNGGGSLIHPKVVLTAAHVALKSNVQRIRAGEWDTETTDEIYAFQERDVASKVVHKDYHKGNLYYDVALLFLTEPVKLAPHIGVACLPPARQKAVASSRCFATGWGKDKFGKEGQYQNILKKVELPVVEHYACQSALRRTRLGRYFILHSSFMCAGGEKDKDVCRGDGGSPLSCPIEYEQDRFMQSGIVSWGIGCNQEGVPGVYVDVAVMRGWIDDKMAGKGYDTSSYTY